tara:strand:+ start:876 stop:1739 length:864 start_codon:yes stop_codon:yes gene_type:complete
MADVGGEAMTEKALLETLIWAKLFDHMLDEPSAQAFMSEEIELDTLRTKIDNSTHIVREGEFLRLTHHAVTESDIEQRKTRAKQHLRELQSVLGNLVGLPQVEGLAVTGSVAAGVNDEDGDVDVLIITRPGWVWRVRAVAIFLAHHHPNGHRLCPNMVMASDHLEIEQSLYGARELMLMQPIKDVGGISSMQQANLWAESMLPNASFRPITTHPATKGGTPWWWAICRIPLVGRLFERFESSRRIRQLTQSSQSSEAIYTRSVCRGHENNHKTSIEQRLEEAMGELQ